MDTLITILSMYAGSLILTGLLMKSAVEIVGKKTNKIKTLILSALIVGTIVLSITYFTAGFVTMLGYYLPSMIFWFIFYLVKYPMNNLASRLLEHSEKINHYFFNVANIYIATGKEDARLASLASAKVAAKEQREFLANYLKNNLDDLAKICKLDLPKASYYEVCYARTESLIDEIDSEDWSVIDATKAKTELYKENKNYLQSLESPDPEFFIKEYDDGIVNFFAHVSLEVILKSKGMKIIFDIRPILKSTNKSLPPTIPYLIEEKRDNNVIERKYHFRPCFGRLSNTSCIKKYKENELEKDAYLENALKFEKELTK